MRDFSLFLLTFKHLPIFYGLALGFYSFLCTHTYICQSGRIQIQDESKRNTANK